MVTPVSLRWMPMNSCYCQKECRQLDIVRYHTDVDELNCQKKCDSPQVYLIESCFLLPCQSAVVPRWPQVGQGRQANQVLLDQVECLVT